MKFFRYFLLIFLCFFSFANSVLAKEYEVLYSVKNSKSADVKYVADFYSRQCNMLKVDTEKDYTLVQIDNKPQNYYFMSFVQTGENTYFYFYSPLNNEQISSEILKRFKLKNLKYSKIKSKAAIQIKKQTALSICENKKKNNNNQSNTVNNQIQLAETYDFSDEAQILYDARTNTNNTPLLKKEKYTFADKNPVVLPVIQDNIQPNTYENIPKGNISQNINFTIPVILQSTINSESMDKNDRVAAVLQDDLYINNQLKASAGSIIYGSATEANKAGGAYRNGTITLVFDRILTTDGDEINLTSEPLVFQNEQSNRSAKITGAMVGSVLLGVAGAAVGGLFASDPHWALRLTTGAIAGALGGGYVVFSSNGEEVELKEGLVLQVKINSVF